MSSSIWTRCAGDSRKRALRLEPWRVVESQHQISTRKLVDSDAEQQLLEQLIDSAKPPDPTGGKLHYLLFTPFRYPPLPYGSRFGTRTEQGIWYGAESQRTAFAEVAYYRLLFLEGSAADLGLLEVELTAFRASVQTDQGIDLTTKPFKAYETLLASPVTYADTQPLGRAMRESGVEAFRCRSARDVEGGVCIGIFTPAAFGRRQPRGFETWYCAANRSRVEFVRRGFDTRRAHGFAREEFTVAGEMPIPV